MKNSLYPFFWQHGEDHQVLETYMEKISESGMGGVCIEARPHPEFVKEGWWNDLDCIINKAKELSMKLSSHGRGEILPQPWKDLVTAVKN